MIDEQLKRSHSETQTNLQEDANLIKNIVDKFNSYATIFVESEVKRDSYKVATVTYELLMFARLVRECEKLISSNPLIQKLESQFGDIGDEAFKKVAPSGLGRRISYHEFSQQTKDNQMD